MDENPALGDVKELKGQIERITYSDAESGYSVLRLRVPGAPELVTVVGNFISPAVGEMLELTGEWQQHPKFGVQFKASTSKSAVPSSLAGIEKYLGSGLVRGIGPSLAAKIVEHFGADSLDMLDNHSERLMELPGVGEKKASAIAASWSEQREMRDVMPFLQSYGIGTGYAVRVYRQYGANTIQVLQENPYRLAIDVFGIGFVTADKIAQSMGFATDSPLRVRAGVLHVMNQLIGEGNVYVPIMELAAKAAEILGVSQEQAERGIEEARLAEDIVCEWYKDSSGEDDCAVYLPAFQYAEVHSAMNLLSLLSAPFNGQYVDPEAAIPWVQEELGVELAERQKDALRLAISSQVMIITGGPGTGKTTLIRAVLKIREARGYKVMLAAPTGRAAKRMAEATGHEAKTIHRMLEYIGRGNAHGDFMRNESNPLECDLLIVDEASMIDQILFHYLLKAIPKGASLILVGDATSCLPLVQAMCCATSSTRTSARWLH
jgi:exodeoxyribonuclease V alpha subunit